MTRYTVTWLQTARNQLAELWVAASDRREVTWAADSIDRELAEHADRKGEAVAEGLRVLNVPPLHVLFSVNEPDRLVEVASVRRD